MIARRGNQGREQLRTVTCPSHIAHKCPRWDADMPLSTPHHWALLPIHLGDRLSASSPVGLLVHQHSKTLHKPMCSAYEDHPTAAAKLKSSALLLSCWESIKLEVSQKTRNVVKHPISGLLSAFTQLIAFILISCWNKPHLQKTTFVSKSVSVRFTM